MGDIQYRKGFIIKKRILREDDILRMANLIHKQFQQGDYKEEYELLFDDQSSITGKNNMDVFKSYEFKRRRCELPLLYIQIRKVRKNHRNKAV